jgi:signal peptidase
MSATAQHAASSSPRSTRASWWIVPEARTGLEDWSRILVATVARGLIIALLGLAFWAAAPAVLGWQPTTVVTGSMEPRIRVGDVVVSRPVPMDLVQTGHVLLADDPDHPGHLRLHRYAQALGGGMMVTKGDANPAVDSTPIGAAAVHGVGFLRVPSIGMPVVWAREGQWLPLMLLALGVAALLALTTVDREQRRICAEVQAAAAGAGPGESRVGSAVPALAAWPSRRSIRHRARRLRRLRTASAALALALLVTTPLATMPTEAAAAPLFAQTSSPASSFTAGTVVAPTVLTCTNISGGVRIGWTYTGETPSTLRFAVSSGSTVAASTTTSTARTVDVYPSGLLVLGKVNLTVTTQLVGQWTQPAAAPVTVTVTSVAGLGGVTCG